MLTGDGPVTFTFRVGSISKLTDKCCTGVVHSFDAWNAPTRSKAGVAARRSRGRGGARLIIDSSMWSRRNACVYCRPTSTVVNNLI